MQDLLKQFKAQMKYFDENLAKYLHNDQVLLNGLYESITYTLFSGGKRIRPIFCFLVGDLFNVSKEKLIAVACATEMVHTSSLIMDDLPYMDDATMRRGKSANHLVFGSDVAALASIALLMRSYEIIMNDPALPGDKKVKVVSKLASVTGIQGMVGGQFVDLKYSNKSIDLATLEFIHVNKTASLFVLSGSIAAEIGDATEHEIQAIENYAQNLGLAFQIFDDILDSAGTKQETGKSLKKDKGNFVKLYGMEKSKKLALEHTQKAEEALTVFGDRNEKLKMLGEMLIDRRS